MIDLQALINGMNEIGQTQRSGYHVTLGELIKFLKKQDPGADIQTSNGETLSGEVYSYRGYYSDLALDTGREYQPNRTTATCGELLETLENTIGTVLTGYKGGDYPMLADTPLWISESQGDVSDIGVVGVRTKGNKVILETKEIN